MQELVVERDGDDDAAERLSVLVDHRREAADAQLGRRRAGDHLAVDDERRARDLTVEAGESAAILQLERLLESGRAREGLGGLAGAVDPVGEGSDGDAQRAVQARVGALGLSARRDLGERPDGPEHRKK